MLESETALAQNLADAAGDVIRPFFRSAFASESKDDASPVTEADRAAEAAMRKLIEQACPDDGIIGEEYGEKEGTSDRTWVLDPIDGTISFMAGRPIFGTLIALMQDGFPVLGVIDQCISGERWVGLTGEATTLNGKAVQTRRCRELTDAVLATSSPHYFSSSEADHYMALAKAIAGEKRQGMIVYGGDCYNYGLLASGHLDIICEAGLKIHDFAALVPIVEGAGGAMCDWNGDPLHAGSDDEAGVNVIALGDPARLDDVIEGLAGQ